MPWHRNTFSGPLWGESTNHCCFYSDKASNVELWCFFIGILNTHYNDIIMSMMVSQITSLTTIYSTIYSGADQRIHLSSASQAFVWWIHWSPANSSHEGPVKQKMFPFDDVIMWTSYSTSVQLLVIWDTTTLMWDHCNGSHQHPCDQYQISFQHINFVWFIDRLSPLVNMA